MGDGELEAMHVINEAMLRLDDDDARGRVLRWIAEKHNVAGVGSARPVTNGFVPEAASDGASGNSLGFADIGDLMHAAEPKDGPTRALVVAYWHQVIEGKPSWGGGDINDTLKNLGHGLANVTKTLNSLMNKRPAFVIQMSKTGRSRQARKTYKLTTAGIDAVQEMITQDAGADA